MNCKIVQGIESYDSELTAFVAKNSNAQIYHTKSWIQLIIEELDCEFMSAIVRDEGGSISAWMPLFLKEGPSGIIANSSPFYGSHGGVLGTSEATVSATIDFVSTALAERNVQCLNIIPPLYDSYASAYDATSRVVAKAERVAHVKNLEGLNSKADLFSSLSGLTRSNLKRKCWKKGIVVERDESEGVINWMLIHHEEQMLTRGVTPKTRAFIEHFLHKKHSDGVEGRIYVAKIEEVIVAAVFICVWEDWAEYLVPVFDLEYKNFQPLSAVIFEAMLDCSNGGVKKWNFGGSGKALNSVHAFKQGWNGEDQSYVYRLLDTGGADKVHKYALGNDFSKYAGFFLYPM